MIQPTPITTETLDNVVSSKSDKSRFPQVMLSVSREEFDALQLTVKQGLTEIPTELPKNLTGYVFIVGPAGSVDSPKTRYKSFYCGLQKSQPRNYSPHGKYGYLGCGRVDSRY